MENPFIDPSECELEQIQFIESIQPFGSLLTVNQSHVITHAAVVDKFGWTAEQLIGRNLDIVLQDSSRIFDMIKDRTEPTSPFLLRELKSRQWLSCIAHQQGDSIILELEFVPADQVDIASLKFMSERRDSIASYLSYIAENMRVVTGYDRVMIYKFGLDWHGEVVAESLSSAGYSFYGHHFPASDIPAIARNLFTQMWVRMIPDVDADAIPLIGKFDAKLDLSKSVLRAASNIHLQYLRNMDVAASMTMSLICDGKLWGLIACHHFSPKYMVAEQRAVCSLLAKIISSRITTLSVSATIEATDKLAAVSNALSSTLATADFVEAVRDNKHSLFKFVQCDGFSFVGEDWSMASEAHAMSPDELSLLIKVFNQAKVDIVATDSIQKTFPELSNLQTVAAGVLAIKVVNNWFVWNRHEIVRSLLWAGDPNKPLYMNDKSESLSPRLSFESWKETVRGTSASWEQFEITAADRFRQMLIAGVESKRSKPRADAHEYLRLIRTSIDNQAAELQNQFKNLDLKNLEA
ncbi:MAG: GAF domain-containing protein [Cyanobacteria bacterium SZAS-4]|nr:GAF domain-containing protein [Cyanobacteria bacterium SZAS-4]